MRLRRGNARPWFGAQGILADQGPLSGDLPGQVFMFAGIDYVQPASEYGNSPAACLQGCPVGDGINAPGQPADDGDPVAGQVGYNIFGDLSSVDCSPPGAYSRRQPTHPRRPARP